MQDIRNQLIRFVVLCVYLIIFFYITIVLIIIKTKSYANSSYTEVTFTSIVKVSDKIVVRNIYIYNSIVCFEKKKSKSKKALTGSDVP